MTEHNPDAESDAARIIERVLSEAAPNFRGLRSDSECLEHIVGDHVHFELPRMSAKLSRSPFPDAMAADALEELGLMLLSASRAARVMRPPFVLESLASVATAAGSTMGARG